MSIYDMKAPGLPAPVGPGQHPHHAFPVHLYHGTLEPVVAFDQTTLDNALDAGYGTEYVHRDYPRMITRGGKTFTVNNAAEEFPEVPAEPEVN